MDQNIKDEVVRMVVAALDPRDWIALVNYIKRCNKKDEIPKGVMRIELMI